MENTGLNMSTPLRVLGHLRNLNWSLFRSCRRQRTPHEKYHSGKNAETVFSVLRADGAFSKDNPVEVKVNEIIKTTKRLCDLCKTRETSKKCVGCGIDICPDCGIWWSTDPWTGIDCGDYWDLVCPDCNEKAQSFIKEAARISMESGERIDELERQWKKSCAEQGGL